MNRFTKIMKSLSLKGLTGKVKFPGRALVFFDLDKLDVTEMALEVGDGTSSDVLMTPIRWLQRAIIEAPLVAKDNDGEPLERNELVTLLEKPNPHYAWEVLIAGTVLSLAIDGNAYWVAALNDIGRPVELWYVPHMNVDPRWPSNNKNNDFITHYQYSIQGEEQKIAPMGVDRQNVSFDAVEGLAIIHFREGVDPTNLRKGLSPLKGLLREIWTDKEAASFTASLLRNNGIPGVIVSPASESAAMTPKEGEAAKEKLLTEYTGSGRGRPLVMLGPTKVEQFGFSPKEMDLSPLRNVSEERVTAALGVVAAVVGFGSGLQQTKVGATMKELRQLSWTNGVIPLQRIVASEVSRTVGPMFDTADIEFDNTGVEALRENQDTKAIRVERLVRAGVLTRAEARLELGHKVFPGDEVYLMSLAIIEVPQGEVRALLPPTNGAGTKEERASVLKLLTKAHSHGAEDAIIDAAPQAQATRATAQAARAIDVIRRSAGATMASPLERVFTDLGKLVRAAATEVLADDSLKEADHSKQEEKQQLSADDILIVEKIMDLVDIQGSQVALQTTLEEGYLVVANEVSGAVSGALGVDFVLGEAAQQNILNAGGLRAGLVDLDQQTRDAIFEALALGREQGLTSVNLARFIAKDVEGGPWGSAIIRARVIARTEGANAANVATLQAAKSMPETEHVQVFDDREGFGDEVCISANGIVLTIEEGESIGLAHPNCTRSFVPINALLMEELFGSPIAGPARPLPFSN